VSLRRIGVLNGWWVWSIAWCGGLSIPYPSREGKIVRGRSYVSSMYTGVGNGGGLWDEMSGWMGVSFNGMNEKMKQTNDDVHRGSFSERTGRASHTLGPPLVYLAPPFLRRANLSRPHPYGKGRGRCSGVGISKQIQAFELEPTSLKRGEGLISVLKRVLEGEIGGEGEGGGGGMDGG